MTPAFEFIPFVIPLTIAVLALGLLIYFKDEMIKNALYYITHRLIRYSYNVAEKEVGTLNMVRLKAYSDYKQKLDAAHAAHAAKLASIDDKINAAARAAVSFEEMAERGWDE